MPELKRKPLYMCSTLEDLQKKVEGIDGELKKLNDKKLSFVQNTADKILSMADLADRVDQDDELAFIYYMRYLHICKKFKILSDKKAINLALTQCDQISSRLTERYTLLRETIEADRKLKLAELKDATENEKLRNEKKNGVITNGNHSINNSSSTIKKEELKEIDPAELKSLIDMRAKNLLIIDCRCHTDYDTTHIIHPKCITLCCKNLVSGKSAVAICNLVKPLNNEFYELFLRRGEYDFIILYDWKSTFNNMHEPMEALYKAMTEWDVNTVYKGSIRVLKGGLVHLRNMYPTYIKNPEAAISYPPPSSSSLNPLTSVSSITFPSLSIPLTPKKIILPPPPTPSTLEFDRSLKPTASIPKASDQSGSGTVLSFDQSGESILSSTQSAGGQVTVPSDQSGGGRGRGISQSGANIPKSNGLNGYSERNGNISRDERGEGVLKLLEELLVLVVKAEKGAKSALDGYSSYKLDPNVVREREKVAEEDYDNFLALQKEYVIIKTELESNLKREREKKTLPSVRKSELESQIERKEEELKRYCANISKWRGELATSKMSAASLTTSANGTQVENEGKKSVMSRPSAPKPNLMNGNLSPRPSSQELKNNSAYYSEYLKTDEEQHKVNYALKRSNSNPNLYKNKNVSNDESIKIRRDLKPKSNEDNSESTSGFRSHRKGLVNLGNTCYMNSIVQCLIHTRDLKNFFMRIKKLSSTNTLQAVINPYSPTKGEVTMEMSEITAMLYNFNAYDKVEFQPFNLKKIIGRYHKDFQGEGQHDAHELLTYLLDWMHEELNKVRTKEKAPIINYDNLEDSIAIQKGWENHLRRNSSLINDIFGGLTRSSVTCINCHKESIIFENFFSLSLPIPESSKSSLNECLDLFTKREEIPAFKCENCKKSGVVKKVDICKVSKYLIFHLNRFEDGNGWKKNIEMVDFPIEQLDMSGRIFGDLDEGGRRRVYQLYAVCNHNGTKDSGHYTCVIRDDYSWTYFSDSQVKGAAESYDVLSTKGYILFYQEISVS